MAVRKRTGLRFLSTAPPLRFLPRRTSGVGGSHLTSTGGENDKSQVSDPVADIWGRVFFRGGGLFDFLFVFLQVVVNFLHAIQTRWENTRQPQTVPKNHHFKRCHCENLSGPCPHVKTDLCFLFGLDVTNQHDYKTSKGRRKKRINKEQHYDGQQLGKCTKLSYKSLSITYSLAPAEAIPGEM